MVSGAHAVHLVPEERRLTLNRSGAQILALEADAFELGVVRELDSEASYDPFWLEYEDEVFKPEPPPDLQWLSPTLMSVIEHHESSARLSLAFSGGATAELEIRASDADAFVMRLLPRASGGAIAWIRVRPAVDGAEGFYGLGEWADTPEHRGKLRPMQLEPELGLESANNENHVPVPLLIGTRGWGLFVKSRRTGVFDVAKKRADRVEVTFGTAEESASGLELHLFGAERPLDITRLYYQATALPLRPAPWALGPWIWRDENLDQAQVEDDIAQIRALDLPTTAIWIDRPYATKVNTFDFDPTRFPDPAKMIAVAHDHGLRVALWHTPYLEEGAEPQRSTADREGYFPPTTGTRLNGWSAPIDLTNAAAFAFWQDNVRRYVTLGIEGFKLDYAEDVIAGFGGGRNAWRFADGSDERTMHYGYTLLYHRVYAETLPASGGFLLCRAGRWGDQAHASVIWPGDMDANLAPHRGRFTDREGNTVTGVGGLPATVVHGLSLGPSGFPLYGADTGGYRHSPPDKETYIRWFEQTALTPVMQVGDSSSEPPWVFTSTNGRDQATLDLYRRYARLHLRLFPYLWSYVVRLPEDGRAIQRAIGLVHPELGRHPGDQYLLGDHLLVAPVVVRDARTKRVVLPPGEWIDWWTGARSAGPGEIEVDAPLEVLPLFLRAGGAVPLLRPSIDAIAPTAHPDRVDSFASSAGPLFVRAALGAAGGFEVYDGTRIVVNETSIEISPGSVFTRVARLELAGVPSSPRSVRVDGVAASALASREDLETASSGWFYEPASRLLHVVLGGGAPRVALEL